MLMIAFASISQLRKSLTRLTRFQDEGWINRDPDIYLGVKVKPMKMNIGLTAWAISQSKYVNKAVINCEKWIQENMPEHKHSCRASNPFPTDYDPDLDTTAELDEEKATYYQSQVGILHGIVNWED